MYELHDVYVGSKDKLSTRIVVYRCIEEQKQKHLRDRAIRELLLRKKQKELSEYKAMYIIKDYFSLFYQALHKNTQELSKVLFRLFNLL